MCSTFNVIPWARKFFEQRSVPMSEDVSRCFINLCLADLDPSYKNPEAESEFLYKVISSRAEHIGLTLSTATKIFLMILTLSPGTAVMYLYALRTVAHTVDIGRLAELFPLGFPSKASLSNMWDEQKSPEGGNYLDALDIRELGWVSLQGAQDDN